MDRILLMIVGVPVALLAINTVLKAMDVLEGDYRIRHSEKARRRFRLALRCTRRLNVRPRPIKAGQIGYVRVR